MFDSKHKLIASRLIERAGKGARAEELIAAIRSEFPDVPCSTIARAAFFAVTRPNVDASAIPPVHEVALTVRRPEYCASIEA
jgi:hypothetical protein